MQTFDNAMRLPRSSPSVASSRSALQIAAMAASVGRLSIASNLEPCGTTPPRM